MPWIPRGLREGIVTTRYPRRPDGYGAQFHGTVVVRSEGGRRLRGGTQTSPSIRSETPAGPGEARTFSWTDIEAAAEACPTAAISMQGGRPRLDRGRCILCGRCTSLAPEVFQFDPTFETSVIGRRALVVGAVDEDDRVIEMARHTLASRVKALRRSIHIRHVDAGSDGAEEWEIAALTNPIYDVQRLGIFFTASPKHADILLATGVGAAGMVGPLRQTFELMPEPKVVIAAGVDAASGGLIGDGYAARGGIAGDVPVDVYVPGSPPTPFGLLQGLLLAVGLIPNRFRQQTAPPPATRGAHWPASSQDPTEEAGQ